MLIIRFCRSGKIISGSLSACAGCGNDFAGLKIQSDGKIHCASLINYRLTFEKRVILHGSDKSTICASRADNNIMYSMLFYNVN